MNKKLVLFLPNELLSKDKEDILINLIKYINNEDKEVEKYLETKLSSIMSENDIISLSIFIKENRESMFSFKNVNKVNAKIRKLLSRIYIFNITLDAVNINANKVKNDIPRTKLFLKELNDEVLIFYSDNNKITNINIDDVYDEMYMKLHNSKKIKEILFYRNVIKNINILRVS